MKTTLQKLIDEHGQEHVLQAAEQILTNSIKKKVPTEYERLIKPEQIDEIANTIDGALLDIAEAGKQVDEAYSNKGDLLKEITQLKTLIQLIEAEAIMTLGGETAVVEGRTARVKTGAEQDMYRRYMSREERAHLAELEGDLQALDINLYKARDLREDAKLSAELVKAKAYVQANLLKFLS